MLAFGVLKTRRFAIYAACNGTEFAAQWMYRLAVGWTVWELTHSGMWLGILAICDLGPALVFGPLGGVLGDRSNPERVIAGAQGVVIANSLAMGAAVWGGVPAWGLLPFAVIGGSAVATGDAARAAIVNGLVPPEELGPAVALNAVIINIARFVGPALAGVIATAVDILAVFPIAALLGLPLLIFVLRKKVAPLEESAAQPNVLRDLADGVAYSRSHPMIAIILLNFGAASLFARGAYELVPGLVGELFDRGVGGLSAMTASIGLGAVVAGLLLTGNRSSEAAARSTFAAAVIAGAAAIAIAFMPVFWGALVASAALGFGIATVSIASLIVVQVEARGDMRTRVLSLWGMIIRAAPALGSLVIGALADRLGFRVPLAGSAAIGVVAALACWLAFRRRSVKEA